MAKIFENKVFQDPAAARAWLESRLWPNGPICGHCGVQDEAKALSSRPGTYQCNACRKQFTVTVGTVFERSHIPLNKWLMATFLFCASKKGVSAHQMHRMLDITYKSAWFMMHRLREAVTPDSPGPLGGRGQVVEADETYFGKADGKAKLPKAGGYAHKMKILSLTERGGHIRSMRIKAGTKAEISELVRRNIHPESTLHTDGAGFYREIGASKIHEFVDHSISYVGRGKNGRKVHTNSLEGYFSVFKRGMVGTYQHIGEQHLNRYLAEFDFRQNTRTKLGVDDETRAEMALMGIVGKRLTYRQTNRTSHH
jgi:transposase-like protein